MIHFALTRLFAASLAALGAIALTPSASAADAEKSAPAAEAKEGEKKAEKKVGDPYTLDSCPVSGEKLGSMGDPVVYDYQGREIRFCCKACVPKFEAEPEKYIAEIDKKMIEQPVAAYPLKNCVVSGEPMGGEHGKIIDVVYNNRLVRLCCKGCVRDLKNDPAAYIEKLDAAAIEQQKADYPLATCVVSGEPLGEKPVSRVVAGQLVQLCCNGCVKKLDKDPVGYLGKIDEARKEKTPAAN